MADWLEVDLGSSMTVGRVEVVNRKDGGTLNIVGGLIELWAETGDFVRTPGHCGDVFRRGVQGCEVITDEESCALAGDFLSLVSL